MADQTGDETAAEKCERLRQRLSVKQRRFCEEFLKTQDAAVAYAKAYGSDEDDEKRALLSRPSKLAPRAFALLERWYIKDYCAALLEGSDVQELLVTRAEVLHTLADRMRNAGEDKDRIRAAEIVGKFIGITTVKRVEVTGAGGGPVKAELGLDLKQIHKLRADFLGVDPKAVDGGD